DWRYKCPSGSDDWITAETQENHVIYVVWDSPKCATAHYTKANINNAVSLASDENTEAAIASKANDNVGAGVFSGCICASGFQANFDAAMGTYPPAAPKGMCCCRAEGLNCVLQVLGIGPYTHCYVNEKPEPGTKTTYPGDCAICGRVYRCYWDGFWNNWEGVVRAGAAGTQCYAPANGSIPIDEGTYTQIRTSIAANLGFAWKKGPLHTDVCTHLAPP
ncbi:MAG: hypothetical protein JW955_08315, partial [Sedimentisphaerales bacterium]|nr:hypothetical protein [Sedimentisphaerales bacterium]